MPQSDSGIRAGARRRPRRNFDLAPKPALSATQKLLGHESIVDPTTADIYTDWESTSSPRRCGRYSVATLNRYRRPRGKPAANSDFHGGGGNRVRG